jgi:hypothetical protein
MHACRNCRKRKRYTTEAEKKVFLHIVIPTSEREEESASFNHEDKSRFLGALRLGMTNFGEKIVPVPPW